MIAAHLDAAPTLSFWPPVIAALVVASLVVAVVFLRVKSNNAKVQISERTQRLLSRLARTNQGGVLSGLLYEVNAPMAWSISDSWTTNITAIGSVLGTVAGTTSALQAYIPNTSAFVAVSLLFGGAAILAPVIYAALATSTGITDPGGTVSGALGTIGGLLLAAIFTLFGFFGEIFVTLDVAIHSVRGYLAHAAFWVALVLVALLVAVYSYRSLKNMILWPSPSAANAGATGTSSGADAGAAGTGRAADASRAGNKSRALSLLSPSPKASATL